jgi:hypothetical protein
MEPERQISRVYVWRTWLCIRTVRRHLRALTVECLPGAPTDNMFVYLQQAVLGFDGDEVWGKELDHINDGEVDVQCPGCEDELVLDLTP